MPMPKEKILEIIKREKHFTVKTFNRGLMKRLYQMQEEGLVELKDSFKDCLYYGLADGVPWKLGGDNCRE